ncbi:MAG: YqeG family HAD IIIA-type phosphatase, partial [Clostridia bacterium]|nr:YqeG family HAD IIIA-type phosphatase [Clostridia bacterium]
MQKFNPDLFYRTLEDISVDALKDRNIKALILDIDNTLVP